MSFDDKIVVNIFAEAQAVARQSFGTVIHLADGLGGGFTERIRFYERLQDVTGDGDLSAAAQLAGSTFFAQINRPPRFAVGRINYAATHADEIAAIQAESDDWYAVGASSRAQADLEALGAAFASLRKLYMAQSSEAAILTGAGGTSFDTLSAASNPRTAGLYFSDDAVYSDIAWLANKIAADPDEQVTTWSNATLVNVIPDTLNATEKSNLRALNGNAYLTLGGVGATGDGLLFDGRYIDTLTTKDWFRARTEEALQQLLLNVSALNTKIPYTDAGIAQIESVVRGVLGRGEDIGHFRPGSGDVTVPKLADIPDADITNRELTLTATAILAGAIEEITLNVAILAA